MERSKIFFFLPNVFTGFNMACGFATIILSCRGDAFAAALILILGAIFDFVDGRIARITDTQSSFGEQFDSMSDVVSFGVAPAFLMYNHSLNSLGRLGAVVAFVYMLCAALRLSRFNANIEKATPNFFQGLPTPGVAMALVGYIFFGELIKDLPNYPFVTLGYSLVFSILMISNLPFCSFKDSPWVKKHKKGTLALIFLISAITFSYYRFMIVTLAALYVAGTIVYYIKNRGSLSEVFSWKSDH